MGIVLTTVVNNCAECPNSVTNAALHDDPFTSTPITTHYVCQVSGGPEFIWHEDARKHVHAKCPHKGR